MEVLAIVLESPLSSAGKLIMQTKGLPSKYLDNEFFPDKNLWILRLNSVRAFLKSAENYLRNRKNVSFKA